MASHTIKTIQKIPASIDQVWDFFSNPSNLKTITHAHLNFRVISRHHGDHIYPGQIIEYKVSPFFKLPLYWMTEITAVEDKKFFIDEQRHGPYKMWHHQHHFKEISGGVEMTDIVHYKNPFWIIGKLANVLFVKKQLKTIFEYRFKITEEVFGRWS